MLSCLDVHPADAVLDDHRHLVGERRVVGDAGSGQASAKQVAVAVLVLQPFAGQRRAAGGAAEQEAAACAMSPAAQIRSPIRWKPNIE